MHWQHAEIRTSFTGKSIKCPLVSHQEVARTVLSKFGCTVSLLTGDLQDHNYWPCSRGPRSKVLSSTETKQNLYLPRPSDRWCCDVRYCNVFAKFTPGLGACDPSVDRTHQYARAEHGQFPALSEKRLKPQRHPW